ncbi:MAG: DUF115 domain-containing protein, partial [Myxococcales bacterium]|nr:DUF115 domain-containing protein [Myxococcales bacterium]
MNGVEEPSRTRSAPATGLSVTIASARSGDPVLRVGEHWLDDPDDPVVAAARFADEEQVQGVDRVVLFGAGLGYRLARLRALGVPHVHAFEPLPRLLQLGRERYPDRFEGAALHTDAGALLEALVESGRPDEHLLLLTTRAYQALFPAALRSVQEAIVEAEAYQRMRHDTLRLRSAAIVEAGVRNLRGLAGSRRPPDLGGLPVFLIGAGPSLDRNAAGLEAAARKGLLVAVNTSAPVLIERNLPIDLLVSIESLDVSENLRRAAPSTSMIALELTANAESAAVLGPERAFFEGTTPLGIAEALGLPRLEH